MKFPAKICIAISLIVLSAAAVWYAASRQKPAAAMPEESLKSVPERKAFEPVKKLELQRYTSLPESKIDTADSFNANALAAALQECAVGIFRAVLPEKSVLLMPLDMELLDGESARVSGNAIIFKGTKEQKLHCQVKINFLADGSCEADYPRFFSEK